jgi:hypothetical protein
VITTNTTTRHFPPRSSPPCHRSQTRARSTAGLARPTPITPAQTHADTGIVDRDLQRSRFQLTSPVSRQPHPRTSKAPQRHQPSIVLLLHVDPKRACDLEHKLVRDPCFRASLARQRTPFNTCPDGAHLTSYIFTRDSRDAAAASTAPFHSHSTTIIQRTSPKAVSSSCQPSCFHKLILFVFAVGLIKYHASLSRTQHPPSPLIMLIARATPTAVCSTQHNDSFAPTVSDLPAGLAGC